MKMLLEMNLLLVFILRIVVASTSDEEEDYGKLYLLIRSSRFRLNINTFMFKMSTI